MEIIDYSIADLVPVVRCKRCKHFPVGQDRDGWVRWPEDEIGFEDDTCPYYCEDGYYSMMPPENGFCDKGKRREDDSD